MIDYSKGWVEWLAELSVFNTNLIEITHVYYINT